MKRYYIAFSGGKDSHILLHLAAQYLPLDQLRAIHINHGWHSEAESWVAHCQSVCNTMGISLVVENIASLLQSANYVKQQGGPEAAARQARYNAFAKHLQAQDCLMTAHHQQDQAETILLQIIRGSGVRGLASMPLRTQCGGACHLRPLLAWDPEALNFYAESYQLHWIEDSSNQNLYFARNFIRHTILPALKERWPAINKTLARSAQHCADTLRLLTEVTDQDLHTSLTKNHTLSISRLKCLPSLRCYHVICRWLASLNLSQPNTAQFKQIQNLLSAKPSAHTYAQVAWGKTLIRRYRNNLYALTLHSTLSQVPCDPIMWDLQQPLTLPDGRTLYTYEVKGLGIRYNYVAQGKLKVQFRQGGERFHAQNRVGTHPLKKLFQEWGVPPWERAKLPLLYYQGQLLAVVGYGIAAKASAQPSEASLGIALSPKNFTL